MKLTCIIFFILSSLSLMGQNEDCSKFKTGEFVNIDPVTGNTEILRTAEFQFESYPANKASIKLKIKWINSCTYRLTFVEGNAAWDALNIPSNHSIIVTITEIGDDYYNQTSVFENALDQEYKSTIKVKKSKHSNHAPSRKA